ncbi:tumor necrosis factor ligand superfamily member 14-like [Scleropages formosus]|uniref:THD domain-containing protein n=1 Tax=Scleropages formosus TaxID=113540 RepID=A0A8C9TTJ8_SCLFO|nr:tumor necrosis factor ligand superfamily member 14-like [Scleropages formosus]
MEDGSPCPQVFVVDSQAGASRPFSPAPLRRGAGKAWRLLWLLVSLLLLGMIVEAFFIYQLYQKPLGDSASTSASASALKGIPDKYENEVLSKTARTPVKPSRPSAHLTGIAIDGMLTWREFGDTFIHGMKLKEGGLLVQTEGYYFIYSRVHFSGADCSLFKHVVQRYTPRYNGPLELMKAKHFHCREKEKNGIDTSYLAGTFHLYKNDSIVVKVEKPSQLLYQESSDNFFGAYMI